MVVETFAPQPIIDELNRIETLERQRREIDGQIVHMTRELTATVVAAAMRKADDKRAVVAESTIAVATPKGWDKV